MPGTKQSRSNDSKEREGPEFKFCCDDSAGISQMMRKFCSGKDETFEFEKMRQMMQKMCCSTSVKSDRP